MLYLRVLICVLAMCFPTLGAAKPILMLLVVMVLNVVVAKLVMVVMEVEGIMVLMMVITME